MLSFKLGIEKMDAFDLAGYLVQKSIDQHKHITNLKLQRLLYFVQF